MRLGDTLILDEDGLYDCNDFNDRLLLGLKGTLSEAELHFLRARMRGEILNEARRGELASPLPVGLLYDEAGHVRLDPDQQVQQAVRLLFETFRRTGAAHATMMHFQKEGLQFPRRLRHGLHQGELIWGALGLSRVLEVLHNPRYAGAFFFGRTRTRTWPDGSQRTQHLPSEEWLALIPQAHVGYITWDEYEENQRRLQENAQAQGVSNSRFDLALTGTNIGAMLGVSHSGCTRENEETCQWAHIPLCQPTLCLASSGVSLNKFQTSGPFGNATIALPDALMSGFAMFCLKDPSLLAFEARQATDHNLSTIFKIERVPCDTQMRTVLDDVEPSSLRPVYQPLHREVAASGELRQYVFLGGSYLVALDGTGYFSSKKVHCPACQQKVNSTTGEVTYYHQLLGGVIIHPDLRQVLPLAPEPIQRRWAD